MTREYVMGPSGGAGGREFVDEAIPQDGKVVEVRVRSGRWIDAVQMIHKTSLGIDYPMPQHGGNGGYRRAFLLDDNEYIWAISGKYGHYVDSIRFHTNKQISRRYGGTGGAVEYRYEAPPGTEIVGFYGRSAQYVDAIGVLVRPCVKPRTCDAHP